MRPGDRPQYDDWAAPRSDAESRREAVGPQGAALILELQRLRHAFELEDVNEAHAPQVRRPARDNLRPAGRQLMRQPKRQQKGRMGRAINVCLEQFGFHTAAQLKRTSKYASEPGEKLAPRQRSRARGTNPTTTAGKRLVRSRRFAAARLPNSQKVIAGS